LSKIVDQRLSVLDAEGKNMAWFMDDDISDINVDSADIK